MNLNFDEYSQVIRWLLRYRGNQPFVLSIRDRYFRYGDISAKQMAAIQDRMQRGETKPVSRIPREPSLKPGTRIEIKSWLAKKLAAQFGLAFLFRNLEVVSVEAESAKAYFAKVKCYTKPAIHCHMCGRDLTNKFSRAAGIGPICSSKYLGLSPADLTERDAVKALEEAAKEIGILGPVWIAKSLIV